MRKEQFNKKYFILILKHRLIFLFYNIVLFKNCLGRPFSIRLPISVQLFTPLSAFLTSHSTSCRVEASWYFPHPL